MIGKSNLLILITYLHQLMCSITSTYPMPVAWRVRNKIKTIRRQSSFGINHKLFPKSMEPTYNDGEGTHTHRIRTQSQNMEMGINEEYWDMIFWLGYIPSISLGRNEAEFNNGEPYTHLSECGTLVVEEFCKFSKGGVCWQ